GTPARRADTNRRAWHEGATPFLLPGSGSRGGGRRQPGRLRRSRGGEQRVGGRVQGGLGGVLHHAHDEADRNHLHGQVRGNAEQPGGQRDEQQRATRHARGSGRPDRGKQAQQQRGGQVDADAQRVHGGQAQHADGDRRAGHVDGGADRDR